MKMQGCGGRRRRMHRGETAISGFETGKVCRWLRVSPILVPVGMDTGRGGVRARE
jgi:hypothetical protein